MGAGLLAFALSALGPAGAAAQGDRLVWSDQWSRAHPAAYAISGGAVGATLVLDGVLPYGRQAGWTGGILFDDEVTEAIALTEPADQERVARVSDVLLAVAGIHPLVDALVVAGLGDTNSDVAWQLTAIAMEVYAATYVLNTLAKRLVNRERPHGRACTEEDRAFATGRCRPEGRLRSFYSGHATGAFAAAGMVCMNHAYLPLYGSEAADAFACGAALFNATVVAVLRVMAQRHWATDVIVGGLVGLAIGLLIPWGLHYNLRPPGVAPPGMTESPVREAVAPVLMGRF